MQLKKTRIFLGMVIILISITGCGLRNERDEDEAPEVILELTTMPDPAQAGKGRILLNMKMPDGKPIPDAAIVIKGDMSHAGMVPVIREAEADEGGEYLADFDWTMPGDWILTITAELPDGRQLVRTVNVNVVGNSHKDMDS
jgi:hypothetical protein